MISPVTVVYIVCNVLEGGRGRHTGQGVTVATFTQGARVQPDIFYKNYTYFCIKTVVKIDFLPQEVPQLFLSTF